MSEKYPSWGFVFISLYKIRLQNSFYTGDIKKEKSHGGVQHSSFRQNTSLGP